MNKSLSRDYQVLLKMIENVNSARDVIKRYNVDFNARSQRYIVCSKDALDLCSFYMAQFEEKIKLLTDSSKDYLNKYADLGIMKYFRNIIDHDYESVNKAVLASYLNILVSNQFLSALQERAKYCSQHRKRC